MHPEHSEAEALVVAPKRGTSACCIAKKNSAALAQNAD